MSSNKRSRDDIDLKKKLAVIEAWDKMEDKNKTKLAQQFGFKNYKNIDRILENRHKYLAAAENGIQAKRSRLRSGKHDQMEEVLIRWIKEIVQHAGGNIPLNGPIVCV